MVVGTLPISAPIREIQQEVRNLLESWPVSEHFNQLSLTHRKGAEHPFYDGLGSIYDREKNIFVANETDYCELSPALDGSRLQELILAVRRWSPLNLGRVRLMRLKPKSCLSYHRDSNLRYHLPIFTNEKALFFFEDHPPIHLPANGQLFWLNTRKYHTAINGDDNQDRLHLVFSTAAGDASEFESFLGAQGSEESIRA